MQITQSVNEGLKRGCKIVLPAESIDREVRYKLSEMQSTLVMKGFRKGKIPIQIVQKAHGAEARKEVIANSLNAAIETHFKKSKDIPVTKPSVDLINANQNISDDLEFTIEYEVFPECPEVNLDELKLENMVVKITEEDVEEELSNMLAKVVKFVTKNKDAKAELGDKVTYELATYIDGKVDEINSGKRETVMDAADHSKNKDELIGMAIGEKKDIKLPVAVEDGDIHNNQKDVVLSFKITGIERPIPHNNFEDLVKTLGFDSRDQLKENVHNLLIYKYLQMSREITEKEILNYLEKYLNFELPQKLVEFEMEAQKESYKLSQRNSDVSDESSQKYVKEAERRVGLALLLADIGKRKRLKLEDEEINNEIIARLATVNFNKEAYFSYLKSTPAEMEHITATVFERKVLNFIARKVLTSKKQVSAQEIDEKLKKLDKTNLN